LRVKKRTNGEGVTTIRKDDQTGGMRRKREDARTNDIRKVKEQD